MRATFDDLELFADIDFVSICGKKMVEESHGGIDALDGEIVDSGKSRCRGIESIDRVV